MKKLSCLIFTFILLLIVSEVQASEININSNNAVLYNLNENKIIYEKNKDQKISIASLTKLMTALVAIENIEDLTKTVSLAKTDYDKLEKQDASSSSLKRNKKYTYEDLLYGLLLESGADCANALARLTLGNEQNFVKKMNEKAKELGMNNTRFANPIGLDDPNNYSTVNDVAILLKEDLRNPILNSIINSPSHKISDGTVIYHTIYGYMKTYKINIPGIQGGKTGYELNSGYALASTATRNNTTLMLITSKANNRPDHIIDAKNIYNYYFNNYGYYPIITKNSTLVTLNTHNLNTDKIRIKAEDDITYYIKKDYNKSDIRTEYEGIDTITLKNRTNEKIGNLKIFYKNELIMNYPIVLNEKIYPSNIIIIISSSIIGLIILLILVIKYKNSNRLA